MLNARTSLVAIVEGLPPGPATNRLVGRLYRTHAAAGRGCGHRAEAQSKRTDGAEPWWVQKGWERGGRLGALQRLLSDESWPVWEAARWYVSGIGEAILERHLAEAAGHGKRPGAWGKAAAVLNWSMVLRNCCLYEQWLRLRPDNPLDVRPVVLGAFRALRGAEAFVGALLEARRQPEPVVVWTGDVGWYWLGPGVPGEPPIVGALTVRRWPGGAAIVLGGVRPQDSAVLVAMLRQLYYRHDVERSLEVQDALEWYDLHEPAAKPKLSARRKDVPLGYFGEEPAYEVRVAEVVLGLLGPRVQAEARGLVARRREVAGR